MDLAPLKKRKFCDFLKSMFLYGLERLERLVFFISKVTKYLFGLFFHKRKEEETSNFLPKPWTNPLTFGKMIIL